MRDAGVCWLSLLAVLAVAGQPVARGSNPGRTVTFDLYRDYLIVARGSAGSLKGLNFMLDTGANPSVIDRRVAQKLHLQELAASIAVIGGNVQGGQSVIPSLELGPVRRENLPVLIEDLSFFQKAFPVRIDAIIGLDLLGQSPFVIDYPAREIHFGSLPVLATSLSLHMQDGLPIVDAELNQRFCPPVIGHGVVFPHPVWKAAATSAFAYEDQRHHRRFRPEPGMVAKPETRASRLWPGGSLSGGTPGRRKAAFRRSNESGSPRDHQGRHR